MSIIDNPWLHPISPNIPFDEIYEEEEDDE
jgi:hypothetical protein